MSGHNKWSSIKHKKGAADAKRGKIFSRISKEIIIAAKEGGGDPDLNARLRSAVAAAKAANMPNDNIDRAIKKGLGGGEGTQLDSLTYEGYAAGGVAVMSLKRGETVVRCGPASSLDPEKRKKLRKTRYPPPARSSDPCREDRLRHIRSNDST